MKHHHIKYEVSDKIYFQFAAQVDNRVSIQVLDQVEDQVWDKVWNEVWNQLGVQS